MTDSPSSDALRQFHPLVAGWFSDHFSAPTEPQISGWPAIGAGTDTLIAAPTGSGKTLAAFLCAINSLVDRSLSTELPSGIDTLYISPLKALSNDVHRNLEIPLCGIRERAESQGTALPPIRTAVRTGDTPAGERAKMIKRPPHILVTTPESLYILLTAHKSRAILSTIRTVIVDEIHAVADDKRGAHLALSLERLDRLIVDGGQRKPVRIGLSATQSPIERIARLLVGHNRAMPTIVDGGHARAIDVAIEITDDELCAIASNEQCGRVYDRIAELVAEHETTLVFVNTRRMVERVAHHLESRLGEEQVVAHHGSLSRRLRFAAEQKLKSGNVRCAVATASLELGIDVGSVDLVVQIGSPRSIATLLQRVGRSGHSLGKTPKGRLFALTRDQLIESAALIRAIKKMRLDEVELMPWPRDILSQHIVASVAARDWNETELYELVRGAAHYKDLPRSEFDDMIGVLAEGMSTRRGRTTAHLHRDRINGTVKARRGARLAAITCGGAIPDNANYPVVAYPDDTPVGSLDEDFAIESNAGDIFLLGNTSWQIRRVEASRVLVQDAGGAPPTIPFWIGEAPARTRELSEEVGLLRGDIDERLAAGQTRAEIAHWLSGETAISLEAAEQMVDYLQASRATLGALPTQTTIIAERFFDEAGGMQLVLHSPLGGRINKAWGLALRKRFCRGFNFELQAAATDDGIVISLGPPHSFPLESVFDFLSPKNAATILEQAVLGSPVFGVRWRWNTTRALAVLRRFGGKKVPPHILRMRTEDLLSVVFPMQQACLENVVGDIEIPDHPLVKETMRDCMTEFMDVDGFVQLLEDIAGKRINIVAKDTAEPSPLSHEIISANPYAYLDDVGLEERRTRAVSLPRGVSLKDSDKIVDASILRAAADEFAPPVRSADELHDLLLSLGLCPERADWQHFQAELESTGRATTLSWSGGSRWMAAERYPALVQALPSGAAAEPALAALPFAVEELEREAAVVTIVRGHLEISGPTTAQVLATSLGMESADIEAALLALEADGAILRGRWTATTDTEWCDRRVLARIHRLTLGKLRKAIEPVSAAALMRFLFRWQRLEPGTQTIGSDGLRRIVDQLQGFELAAGAWERDVLPARINNYERGWLDSLCLSGEVAWARLSPRRSAADTSAAPTKTAPLTLMQRRDLDWLRAPSATGDDLDSLSDLSDDARAVFEGLSRRGALFLPELVSEVGLAATAVEEGLWQLVGAGLATADGFASLRVLIDRRRGQVRGHFDGADNPGSSNRKWQSAIRKVRNRDARRPAHSLRSLPTAAGRWSLLAPPDPAAIDPLASARQLLTRYGVVFRDLLGRESNLPPWRELLEALRRLEARGVIRGGRFVSGFVGEQFALPEAVDGLRAARHQRHGPSDIVRLAATDPLNLVGVTSPGPRVPAILGNAVLFRAGVAIASIEAGELVMRHTLSDGERVEPDLSYIPPAEDGQLRQVRLPF